MLQSPDPPNTMVFPKHVRALRTLIIRNPTQKDFIIKLVPSCDQVFSMEGRALLVQKRRYAEIVIGFDPTLAFKNKLVYQLAVYARPIEIFNHASLRGWLKSPLTSSNQLVTRMTVRIDNGFSASQVVVDLPGGALLWEPVSNAILGGVDEPEARTCLPIDGDTATGIPALENEIADANKLPPEEK